VKWDNPDRYSYPGTTVLRNHLDITDAAELATAERLIVGLRSDQLFAQLPSPPHDLKCLLGIHRILFGELYPFAGELRKQTGRMSKVRESGSTVLYGDSDFVPEQISNVFRNFARENALAALPLVEFAERAGYFYGELDAIHPFREGNSRTLRIFFSAVALNCCLRFDWNAIASAEYGRHQLCAARDLAVMNGDFGPLAALFASILAPL
jgi:cell filamentation protein